MTHLMDGDVINIAKRRFAFDFTRPIIS